jgi:hypothetical protein
LRPTGNGCFEQRKSPRELTKAEREARSIFVSPFRQWSLAHE